MSPQNRQRFFTENECRQDVIALYEELLSQTNRAIGVRVEVWLILQKIFAAVYKPAIIIFANVANKTTLTELKTISEFSSV